MKRLNKRKVQKILPKRALDAHKGDFGRVLLLCGSRGYTGAAALSAMGALRSGAGLVYLGVPESIYVIEAAKLNEPIVFPLPEEKGMFSEKAVDDIIAMLPKMDAVLVGPGMGNSSGTFAVVKAVLEYAFCPVVLDADGINVLSGHIDLLRGRTGPTVLTPHAGEFKRLGFELTADREAIARNFASQTGSVLLLKGNGTVISDGNTTYLNSTGNPGMAVGGSGDVLAGMITALLGQKIPPLEAAACAAWLHGAAGDICAKKLGQYGMLPTDMLQVLPRLLK